MAVSDNQSILTKFIRSASTLTDMSSSGQLLQAIFDTHENTASGLLDPVEMGHARNRQDSVLSSVPPEVASTLKRSHWKNIARFDNCSEEQCKKKFSKLDKRKNCTMCGSVFCKNCTKFTRKLSSQAVPDPLGTSYHVCHSCLMMTVQNMGQQGNWTDYFGYFRQHKIDTEMKENAESQSKPLTQIGTLSNNKRARLNQELERLKVGYETQSQSGWMKHIVSDFKVPSWQKSLLWVDQSNAHQCRLCHSTFKLLSRKINCRVCGQVYCSTCISKNEVMLFVQSGEKDVGWAINGKEGGPQKQPKSFLLVQVCKVCISMLEEILIEEIEGPPEEEWEEKVDFLDCLSNLEPILFKSRLRIENYLPEYLVLVESMDIVDGSTRSSKSKNPVIDLACAQTNLSDQFSQLAMDSQKLRLLEPLTPTQVKLLKHVTVSVYSFYEDNMYTYKSYRKRLACFMPSESIENIQKVVNKLSVEKVHVFLRQIMYEAINLEVTYNLPSCNIMVYLAQYIDSFEIEMEDFFEKINEDWDKHYKAVIQMVQEDFEGSNPEGKKRRRIRIPSKIPKTPFRNVLIVRKILEQCSYYIHECLRELNAKTPELFFKVSKREMKQMAEIFDKQVAMLIQNHPQVFQADQMAPLFMNDYATGYRNGPQ